jgi:hypothetical protein
MRPGQGNRRNNRRSGHGGGHGGGGHNNGGHRGGNNNGQPRSAMSLRNQIFDSNGPDTRVRGNAFQVHEKYQALAKDALSSGDRVLAENYLQHAEHYYRIIEAINEATANEQRQRQAAYAEQPQPQQGGNGYYNNVNDMAGGQQPAQTPLGSLRSPMMDESEIPSDGMINDADEDADAIGNQSQVASGGRR